jgi:AraC-like DNA-binding protein
MDKIAVSPGSISKILDKKNSRELEERIFHYLQVRSMSLDSRPGQGTMTTGNKLLSRDAKFILQAEKVVHENLDNDDFGVKEFAEGMNMSRTQLFRKIRSLMISSPANLIHQARLTKAAELILAKTDTVTQISYLVGFKEPSHFSKCFRKKFGMSPSKYGKG